MQITMPSPPWKLISPDGTVFHLEMTTMCRSGAERHVPPDDTVIVATRPRLKKLWTMKPLPKPKKPRRKKAA